MSVILTDLSPEALAAREENALAEFGAFVKEFDEKLAPYGAQTRLSLIWNDWLPERPPVKPGYRCSVRCELVRNGEPILKDPFSPSPEPRVHAHGGKLSLRAHPARIVYPGAFIIGPAGRVPASAPGRRFYPPLRHGRKTQEPGGLPDRPEIPSSAQGAPAPDRQRQRDPLGAR